jgi:hypothetical protein
VLLPACTGSRSVLTKKAVVPLPCPLGGLFLRLGSWLACKAKNELSEDILPTDNEAKDDQAGMKSTPHTKEVWFGGTHSDM